MSTYIFLVKALTTFQYIAVRLVVVLAMDSLLRHFTRVRAKGDKYKSAPRKRGPARVPLSWRDAFPVVAFDTCI